MNRIRLLPEHVANQIAVGEVVERPASVVKELVENSLDAEDKDIRIEVQAGGRSLIRVVDDGVGMNRDDALLCLERHATSKIRLAEDLAAIGTPGFRGEALPSIASVSRFTLVTRERHADSPEGVQVTVSGGKILEVKAAAQVASSLPGARLLVVGEGSGHFDLMTKARSLGVGDRVVATGYVADEALPEYLAAVDVCLNLRWPTGRETSAAWLRCLAAG